MKPTTCNGLHINKLQKVNKDKRVLDGDADNIDDDLDLTPAALLPGSSG